VSRPQPGPTARLGFLSPEWFEALAAVETLPAGPAVAVLEQVVTGTPYGDVAYLVEVSAAAARLLAPPAAGTAATPMVTITTDWRTACSIASGRESAQRALAQGMLKVTGDLSALGLIAAAGGDAAALDAIPESIRARTTFD